MKELNTEVKDKQLNEFKFIIQHYILRLLGITQRNLDNVTETNLKNEMIYFDSNFIYFKKDKHESIICCKISVGNYFNTTSFTDEIKVLEKILEFAPYELFKEGINYFNTEQKELIYEYAVQYGLCNALIGNNDKVHALIKKLDEWSCKTYEGKKVPFAFIIDSKVNIEDKTKMVNYLEFLDSDYSATITDGITSVIELDSNCNFLKYHSICTDTGIIGSNNNGKIMPLRFAQILSNYVIGNRTGIFLLTNGDILLAKQSELKFVKRNNKWVNFSSERYINTLFERTKKEQNEQNINLYKQIYATTLDVSFTHSGGIIAVVNYTKLKEKNILNFMDDLSSNLTTDPKELFTIFLNNYKEKYKLVDISDTKKLILKKEFDKVYIKRQALFSLLGLIDEKILFSSIDRKLRTELCGLDGATILDENGYVISFGAIIQNNSGSSGGGRGAATSKLSECNGFATKISTDGYIELYQNGEIFYQIK